MRLPLLLHLKIVQLEQYHLGRYLLWSIRSVVGEKTKRNKAVWTLRLKLVMLVFLFEILLAGLFSWKLCLITIIFAVLWPTPLLAVSFVVVRFLVGVYEYFVRVKVRKLLSKNDLKIVAITGSFGKTTTKEYLYRILDRWKYTLKTPESFNTLLGIYYVLKKELNSKHKIFICEMGAFVPGDIRLLARVVDPDFGMVTAVGKQHLERFGLLENILQTKFELVDYVGQKNSLVNTGSDVVRDKVLNEYKDCKTYSAESLVKADCVVDKVRMGTGGMDFSLTYKGKSYFFKTTLFGRVQLENIVGAIFMAFELEVPVKIIKEEVELLSPPEHRAQCHVVDKVTVIENTYSSNRKSFEMMMEDITKVPGSKALITPGLVELGNESREIHESLGGQAAEVFSEIRLIGKTDRTKWFENGLKKKKYSGKIVFEKEAINPWRVFEKMQDKFEIVLMENDLPDSYY